MKNSLLTFAFLVIAGCATAGAPPGKVTGQCADCGTVQSIGLIEGAGQTSGAGAIMGAVVGNPAEKQRNSGSYYRVTVLMDRGITESVNIAHPAGLRPGDRVRVLGQNLEIIR